MSGRTITAARAGAWLAAATLVLLGSRALVYALAPHPTLIGAELEYSAGGPGPVVLALLALAVATALSVALVCVASVAVTERARLESPKVAIPRISALRVGAHAVALWCATSIAFALLESYLHWRAGLGWHGIRCLVGPIHRDAIPVLAALSLVASALAAVAGHLVAWMRRVVTALRRRPVRLPAAKTAKPRSRGVLLPSSLGRRPGGPRAPPSLSSTV